MRQFEVTGMSCAACQARVEKAVGKVPGVTSCAVSLLTNSMGVEGDASDESIIRAVVDAGYGAKAKTTQTHDRSATGGENADDPLADRETPVLIRRLIISAVLLIALMLIKLPWVQMILALGVILINNRFFVSGFRSVIHGAPNMDTLVALGSGVSFLWSIYAFAAGGKALYFESAAMILVLITVGKLLEARSKGKTTDALRSLMRLAPQTAVVLRDDKELVVPIDEVGVGDVFVVRPGDSIPVDGIVVEGETTVNESALTGESVPVDKTAGDAVSAATLNQTGNIRCRATRVGEDTTLSQIIKMVSDAAATKAPIAKVADRVSGVFVPVVIGVALVTLVVWLITGAENGYALERAISVLVISCPCALGLATPVAIMVGNGVGAKNGVLFKTAVSLEQTGKTEIVVLDKTGTITDGTEVKEDSAAAVNELKNMGLEVVMLTGDKQEIADRVAADVGIDHIFAEVLPGEKEAVVRSLKEKGKVAMVGDGINDAPALTAADTGIAIGAGTDVAIDAADVVLMNSRLSDVAAAIRLSRATLRIIHQNLFWAFFYNVLCIPLAAGCYIGLLGWELDPMIGAAAMSLSSFCVVTNALRLNLFKMHSDEIIVQPNGELSAIIEPVKEETLMEKTLIIEGMMCPMCEAHTKKALENIEGVESAVASHVAGNAVVQLSDDVDNAVLKAAVEEEGYKVTEIK